MTNMKQNKKRLHTQLTDYNETMVPMHMPGHKRNTALLGGVFPYAIDITEIEGFDNLHNMQGILKDTAELAARLYGASASFPLVGGSTCGILAAIHALVPFGSHMLMARDCHKSVYHAIELFSLTPHYIAAEADAYGIASAITPEAVDAALSAGEKISLVILTSPTYEGVVCDIPGISEVCKKHQVRLMVDAAHGAHFGLSDSFSQSLSGADVAVMSLHKTLPALTQTALLHVFGNDTDAASVARSLRIFETSSPSYVLLASIDECLHLLDAEKETLFARFCAILDDFYNRTESLQYIRAFCYDDKSKILLSAERAGLTGAELAALLRANGIEPEMSAAGYVLAITSVCDTKQTLSALFTALLKIDRSLTPGKSASFASSSVSLPPRIFTPFDALKKETETVPLGDAAERICGEYIWAYPPGVPLIVPGETITKEWLFAISIQIKNGVALYGTSDAIEQNKITVIKENSN